MMRKLRVPEENVSKWAAFKITMDITHEGDKFYMKTLGMYFMFATLMVHGFRILFFFGFSVPPDQVKMVALLPKHFWV